MHLGRAAVEKGLHAPHRIDTGGGILPGVLALSRKTVPDGGPVAA